MKERQPFPLVFPFINNEIYLTVTVTCSESISVTVSLRRCKLPNTQHGKVTCPQRRGMFYHNGRP